MRIEHLECLVILAETGSITKAGQKLFTTQQNISKMLKQLEEEIGYPLFNRSKKGVSLTKEGKIMLTFAQQTLDNFSQAKNKIYNLQTNTLKGELHLYAFYLAANTVLSNLTKAINHYYPHIKVYLHEADILQVLKNVNKYEDAIGIVPIFIDEKFHSLYRPYLDDLKILPILEDSYMCVTSKQSSIAANKSISIKQFLKHPLIMNQATKENENNILYQLFNLFAVPNVAMRTSNSILFIRNLLNNPEYVGLSSKRSYENNPYNLYENIAVIPFREHLNYNICLVWQNGKSYSKIHRAVGDLISSIYVNTNK